MALSHKTQKTAIQVFSLLKQIKLHDFRNFFYTGRLVDWQRFINQNTDVDYTAVKLIGRSSQSKSFVSVTCSISSTAEDVRGGRG